jgi:indole-3-glycerol phosphate synthase
MSTDFLAQMAQSSQERVAAAQALCSSDALRARIANQSPPPPLRRAPGGFDLIAELKLRSPAVGQLSATGAAGDLAARVARYAEAGAAAVSVLTEPSRFDGSLEHLDSAARVLREAAPPIPAMRKDFIVDPYQILEARCAGAGGVLLILRMLPADRCERLVDAALACGLFVLLETFDEAEIARAAKIVAARRASPDTVSLMIGVNCRDLVTLQVVPGRLERLASALPDDVPRVAESGVASAADAGRLAEAGYDLALVGSALMSGETPRELAAAMLTAGRAGVARRRVGTRIGRAGA